MKKTAAFFCCLFCLGGSFPLAITAEGAASSEKPAAASKAQKSTPRQGAVQLEEGVVLGLLWPLRGKTSSPYGKRFDPYSADITAHHAGVDIAAPQGTQVAAARAGKVTFAAHSGGYGNLVILRHSSEMETRYGHLNSISAKKDAFVRPGQIIGAVGSTGRSTGPHLHFEVRVGGRPVDPLKWLVPYGFMMPPSAPLSGPKSDERK